MLGTEATGTVGAKGKYVVPHWFRLDNAATIYPAARTRTYACTFRITFVINENADPELLRRAVDDIAPRFPSFFVQLRTGLFWYYLERVDDTDVVVEESEYPCHRASLVETDKPAFRIIYYKRRIGIEMFHSVSDGGATLIFLKTLVARYLELKGYNIPKNGDFIDIGEEPKEYEHEDVFQKLYKKDVPALKKEEASYQYRVKTIPNYFQAVHGIIPVEDLKAQCKPLGLTITDYFAAVLLYSIYLDNPKNKKPIKVSVPISLRPVFGYDTLRNFSLFTNIGFVPKADGSTTFDDIVESIRGKIKADVNPEAMLIPIKRNVGSANNPAVRFLPNILKRPLLKAAYHLVGQRKFLCCMTNLGICKMPPEMREHIDRIEVLLGGAPRETLACAIGCLDETLNFTFTGSSKRFDIPRNFFTFLTSKGIRVRVETNNKEAWS